MSRLEKLRETFAIHSVDGFIVPSQDEYLSEYVPDCFRRLEWVSGFTGSAGIAIILKDKAAFFTDGRYMVQAQSQLGSEFELYNISDTTAIKWLSENLNDGVVGYDSWLHTKQNIELYKVKGVKLRVVENLVDKVWGSRPKFPTDSVFNYPIRYSGQYTDIKIKNLCKALSKAGGDAVMLTASDSICWLLNIRGNDIKNTPLLLAYALVLADGKVSLYADQKKFPKEVVDALGSNVKIYSVSDLKKNMSFLQNQKILLDPKTANSWFFDVLESVGATILEHMDPCCLPKAIKNEVEVNGMREAHIIDGVALTKFLCWLDCNIGVEKINEVSAADKLEEFRRESELLKDLSFSTISGYASNGAIVHYQADINTCAELDKYGVYLVDSGGQYLGGTTDVTRTVALGDATDEQKKNFTLVLKGHIAVATAEFDCEQTGEYLDVLARQYLNAEGLDYDHGTGHGVGSYLGVHEGPQGISKKSVQRFYPGMVVSNEPGYYKEGEYGIRIESLVLVVEKDDKLGFETITMAPIDLNMIDESLLNKGEKEWLNNYHATVKEKISALLDEDTKNWLEINTKPLV